MSGYREHAREIIAWLKSDLFEEGPAPIEVDADTRAFTNPGGWTVLVSRRQDLTGCSGGIVDPQGKLVLVTSRLDVFELVRRIP